VKSERVDSWVFNIEIIYYFRVVVVERYEIPRQRVEGPGLILGLSVLLLFNNFQIFRKVFVLPSLSSSQWLLFHIS
jgi:hypothetical protein